MIFRKTVLGFFLLIPFFSIAQTSPQYNSAEIRLAIEKLNTVGSALYIAAHPDDENTKLLAYLAEEKKFRTGYLSLTRGDGGQNLIGNEQSELLGLVRTQELLAARRIDGAEQFFSRAIDFGFSKSSDETFRIWDHQKILADAVWVIRKFRPDIIITRFPEDARAGHGQHAASAIIAREAFLAAADAKQFPEQLKYVQPWQAKRIVWNTSNFGGNAGSDGQLKLDVGVFNPLLGKGYGEIAAVSRTNHKSQGFGSAPQRGGLPEYFSHTAGEQAMNDIFEGINSNWDRLAGGEHISELISQAEQSFDMVNPHASVPALVHILAEIENIKDDYWREVKSKELRDLIAAAAGLWFESYASQPINALGDSIQIQSQILLRSEIPVSLKQINGTKQNLSLQKGQMNSVSEKLYGDVITEPYWLLEKHGTGMYTIPDELLAGNPENTPPVQVSFVFNINNKDITYTRPVVFKRTDQVRGEVYQPLVIAPQVTATISDKAYIFSGTSPRTIDVQIKSFSDKAKGSIIPRVPTGWQASPQKINFDFGKNGEEKTIQFLLTPSSKTGGGIFSLDIESEGSHFNRGTRVINYEHIPVQTLFPIAEARVEQIDLKIGGRRVGYIAGAGDLIPEALEQVGYQVIRLSDNQLLNSNLSDFDAIITGVRLYNVNQNLSLIQPKLMDYVKNGGTLLVQYNVNNPLLIENIGPYPFRITRDRVTEEDAEVRFIDKNHPVLNYPNKITEKDFEGWIQERGLYFTSGADSAYSRILSMNDTGESPKDGSLLVANYGKGRFVYTSLVFFRELPAGVPGAYRLFVNLITKN